MDKAVGLFFRAALKFASLFSRPTAHRLARGLAGVLRWSNAAADTRTNIELCYPHLTPAQRQALTARSLQHMALLFFELGQLRFWSQQALFSDLQIVGEDVLQQSVAGERGTLLLVPHFGNWEIMASFLGHFYSVAALYDRPKVASLEAEILYARQRDGGEMFAIGVGGIRAILQRLKKGGLVAILPDQVPSRDAGEYADFFQHPALTMSLPHQLITRTSPDVLMASVRRLEQGNYGYELTFEPLPQVDFSNAAATARSINAGIEQVIHRAPEQYQWEYKRFKRPPGGGKGNIYRRQ